MRRTSAQPRRPGASCPVRATYSLYRRRLSGERLRASAPTRRLDSAARVPSCETNSMAPSYFDSAAITFPLSRRSNGWLARPARGNSAGRTASSHDQPRLSPPDSTRHFFSRRRPRSRSSPQALGSTLSRLRNESSSDWNTVRSPSSSSMACCAK